MIRDKISRALENISLVRRVNNQNTSPIGDEKLKDKYNPKTYLTRPTEEAIEGIKVFLEAYIPTITILGLLSTFLPVPIALSIGGIVGIMNLLTRENPTIQKIAKKIGKYISSIIEKIGNLHSIIPFKYPVIIAEESKYQEILSTLDNLPLKIVNNLSSIQINNEIYHKYDAVGLVVDRIYATPIHLYSNPYPYTLQEVLIHEIGHTIDIGFKLVPTNYKSSLFFIFPKYPWGIKDFVSDYAQTKPTEDFAESFLTFYLEPQKLKETSLYKYEYIKNLYEQNFLEKLVDNRFLRNIGKQLSKIFSKFPVIRHVLDVFSFYSSHKKVSDSLEKMLEANRENDRNKMIKAKFSLLSGLLMIKKSIYSLPLMVLNLLLSKILDHEKIRNSQKYSHILDFMEKSLNLSLGFTIGPIGISIYQTLQTDSNKKNKIIVLTSGLITTLIFHALKLSFPTFIPIANLLETISVMGITEFIKRKISE
ncbi:MAG: hypothetical protein RMJ51_02760 [Candidatus Calescibacterium sp.]|nr:hypothetical protein [Candidatus Calescibacterium sp.]MCX7972251.1 hypothetical protein [bacterium]MDW8195148.1 hypothetical protein [Candidatus Calescibacterium sp.]